MLVKRVVRRAIERGWADHDRHGVVVYHAEVRHGNLFLWHYKTLILGVDLERKEIIGIGGKSASDANAINRALEYLEVEGVTAIKGEYHTELVLEKAAS